MEKDAVRAERSPTRCPYCRDELGAKATDDLVACAACGARHHAGCHTTHGRCATCQATDVLVPARRRRAGEPPTGSRLRVDQDADGATRFSWAVGTTTDAVLTILAAATVVFLPVAIWMWVGRSRLKEQHLLLGPDWLDLPVNTVGGLSWKRLRVRRDELGAVRVHNESSVYVLTVDVGIERHVVWTGHTVPSLTPPEMEWLAAQLTAWRDQA